MKNITLLALVAASSPAFAQASAKSGLSYDRVSIGYASNDSLKSMSLNASALLGDSVIVSGFYADSKGKGDLAGYSGNQTGFGLAYKFNVGPGDLALGLGYAQGQFGTFNGFAVGEQTSFGIQYRQAITDALEFSVGYVRMRTSLGALTVQGGFVYAGAATENSNNFALGLRYNLTKSFDVSLVYAFEGESTGGNTFGFSAGLNF